MSSRSPYLPHDIYLAREEYEVIDGKNVVRRTPRGFPSAIHP